MLRLSATEIPKNKSRERDLRIDFLRGLALLMIFISHQEVFCGFYWLRKITLVSLVYCDALEVFIFLSGYVCALTYGKTLTQKGFWTCQAKAIRRCGQLYIANLTTFLIVLNIAIICVPYTMALEALDATFFRRAVEAPWGAFVDFLVMRYYPIGFNILHMYIFFLLATPALIWALNQASALTLFVCGLCYLGCQFSSFFGHQFLALGMNLFAWQFVYAIGLSIGLFGQSAIVRHLVQHRVLVFFSLVIFFAFFSVRTLVPMALEHKLVSGELWQSLPGEAFAVASKSRLHPLRLLNFLVLAHIAAVFCPKSGTLKNCRLVLPVISCGQNSLVIFSFGLFLNYLIAFAFVPSLSLLPLVWRVPFFEALGIISQLKVASFLSNRKQTTS